ncbi:hypothetical protein DFJ74DRAFT_27593 [Hyaloraphidium curvatum]|nr:hypothetical protein DFJ74DRAFT_27593 [Hyaloraphidium curvatum]
MDLNVTSFFLIVKHSAPYLAKTAASLPVDKPLRPPTTSIVAISSLHSVRTMKYHSAYAVSKSAVCATVRAAAADLGSYGIRVNSVMVGFARQDQRAALLTPSPSRTAARSDPHRADCTSPRHPALPVLHREPDPQARRRRRRPRRPRALPRRARKQLDYRRVHFCRRGAACLRRWGAETLGGAQRDVLWRGRGGTDEDARDRALKAMPIPQRYCIL